MRYLTPDLIADTLTLMPDNRARTLMADLALSMRLPAGPIRDVSAWDRLR